MDIRAFIEELSHSRYGDRLVHIAHLPPRAPRHSDLNPPLAAPLPEMLRRQGVERLYTHQADAIRAARAGHDVIVSTGTASGKTLCYILPALEALAANPKARALFVYPTKALAQDQLRALRELLGRGLPRLVAATYDGDTPVGARSRLRRAARILQTCSTTRCYRTTASGLRSWPICATWCSTRHTSTAASLARTWQP